MKIMVSWSPNWSIDLRSVYFYHCRRKGQEICWTEVHSGYLLNLLPTAPLCGRPYSTASELTASKAHGTARPIGSCEQTTERQDENVFYFVVKHWTNTDVCFVPLLPTDLSSEVTFQVSLLSWKQHSLSSKLRFPSKKTWNISFWRNTFSPLKVQFCRSFWFSDTGPHDYSA